MFRYRRYRAFIAFAVISIFAFYHFSGFASWTLHNPIGAGSPNLHPQSPQDPKLPQAEPVPQPDAEDKERTPEYRPPQNPIKDALDHAATTTSRLAQQTPLGQALPQQSKTQTLGSAQTSSPIAKGKADHDKPIATEPPTLPIAGSDAKALPSKQSTKSKSSSQQIHWSKQSEHFPVSSTIQLPTGTPKAIPRIQHVFEKETDAQRIDRTQKLRAIKEAATHAWSGYRENAWAHDEVRPVTGGFKDPFCGWAATLVDALDTLWIMGMKDEFEEAVRAVGKIDFTTSPRKDIPLFETTIRYLGGMLSAYDISGAKYVTLLDKAVELAEILMGAFDTPNRMPVTYYHWMPTFASQPHRASNRVVMAELGSLSMEFTRLAQITKEPRYYDAVDRVTDAFHEWQQKTGVNGTLVPGLFPTYVDASGCEKPNQMAPPQPQEQLVGDGTPANAGQPVQGDRSPGQGPLSGVAVDDKASPAHGVPGKVKIAGWDDPIEEGSLDSKAAKDQILQKTGTQAESVPAAVAAAAAAAVAKPVGKLGKISGWDDESGSVVDSKITTGETLRKVPDHLNSPPVPPPVVNVAKDSPEKKQTKDGGLGAAAAKNELFDDLYRHSIHDKQKRQLGGELAEGSLPTIPDHFPPTIPDAFQDATRPRVAAPPPVAEADICLPRGLAATHGSNVFTIGGMADSTYEYFPKQYLLLGGLESKYKDLYDRSMDAVIEMLLFRPMTPGGHDILFAGAYSAFETPDADGKFGTLKPEAAHLTCFAGAMFAMGAKVFGRKQDLEIGAKLTDGCVWAYNATATGIMPESALLSVCEDQVDCAWNKTKYYKELDPYLSFRTKVYEPVEVQATAAPVPVAHEEGADESQAQIDTAPISHPQKAAPEAKVVTDTPLKKRQSPGKTYPKISETSRTDDDYDTYISPTRVKDDDEYMSHDVTDPYDADGVYHAPPPPTHEEYVEARIDDERLPGGFTKIVDHRYILRPEAIESVFYLHRITGNPHWRQVGWQMFTSIQARTRTEFGHSALADVTSKESRLEDSEESFWLAETLKYFFLLFEDEDVLSLDDWVFNTEAHGFKRPDAGVAKKVVN